MIITKYKQGFNSYVKMNFIVKLENKSETTTSKVVIKEVDSSFTLLTLILLRSLVIILNKLINVEI